jgi:hypothetical protein
VKPAGEYLPPSTHRHFSFGRSLLRARNIIVVSGLEKFFENYNVTMKVSRRRVLQVLPAAAAVPAYTQENPQPRASQVTPEDEEARQRMRLIAQIVRQVNLPMATEPAFKFIPHN